MKVWRLADARPGSPSKSRLNIESTPSSPNITPKALTGRNCLLGALAESTFTSVASISDTGAVVGTDKGSLCFIDDREGAQKLTLIQHMGFGITSLAVDSDRSCIWTGGRDGQIQSVPLSTVENSIPPPSPTHSESSLLAESKNKKPAISCMGYLTSHLVALDVTRAIRVYPIEALGDDDLLARVTNSLPGYRDAVLGVSSSQSSDDPDVDFFTWSCRGTVDFWDIRGRNKMTRTVPLETSGAGEESSNELKVLRTTDGMDFFVAGDKFGVLRYQLNCPTLEDPGFADQPLGRWTEERGDVQTKLEHTGEKSQILLCIQLMAHASLPVVGAIAWSSSSKNLTRTFN